MNKYKMILWSRSKDIGIDNMADIAYEILNGLAKYGDEIKPKYLTARKKSLAKEFVLDSDSIRFLLEKKVDKTGLKQFNHFTSQISFFSSMDEKRSSSISIFIGNCGPKFNNTCVVSLPEGFSGLTERREEFVCRFKQLIKTFRPYYGFVSNDNIKQSGDGFWLNNKPTYTHWINYYDKITAEAIGIKSVLSIVGLEEFESGYFFMLQEEPIDVDNPQHMEKQRKMNELLKL